MSRKMDKLKKVREDPNNYYCCGRFKIFTSSYIVIGIELVIIFIAVTYSAVTLAQKPKDPDICDDEHIENVHKDVVEDTKSHCMQLAKEQKTYDDIKFILYAIISVAAIQLIAIVILFVGMMITKHHLVLPHFVVQILLVLFLIFFSVFLGVHHQKIFLVVVAVLICIIQFWFLYVIWCLYGNLKSQKTYTLRETKTPVEPQISVTKTEEEIPLNGKGPAPPPPDDRETTA